MDIEKIIASSLQNNDVEQLEKLERELFAESKAGIAPYTAAIDLTRGARDTLAKQKPADSSIASDFGSSELALNLANRIATAKRKIQFRLKTAGSFDGLVIVSEGDSWFQYPVFLKDIIDHLSDDDDKACLSLGAAGDLLSNMVQQREYVNAIANNDADVFLISGGGNELVGDGRLSDILRPYDPALTSTELIDQEKYSVVLSQVKADYRTVIEDAFTIKGDILIVGHTYDVPLPIKDGKWIGSAFEELNIPLSIGQDVMALIFSDFAEYLAELQAEFSNYFFVDARGTVGNSPKSWADEIHPKNKGFGRVAAKFRELINTQAEATASGELAPVSAPSYSSVNLDDTMFPALGDDESSNQELMSAFSQRTVMAAEIVTYEARPHPQGHLTVYYLDPDDGGGKYEVAGINERYHKAEADHLVALIKAGRQREAMEYTTEFIAGYTDRADRWCRTPAVEFYLRDCIFNRGPGGGAWIAQHAVGVLTDRVIGPITRRALAEAESDPRRLLDKLRASRETYERRKRDESSRYWRGLVNRWNKALNFAGTFLADSSVAETASERSVGATSFAGFDNESVTGQVTPASERILNCLPSQDVQNDWAVETAIEADIVRMAPYPDEFDLREPWWAIGDQSFTGSCVGWAAADSLFRWHFVKSGMLLQNERLSVRFVWMASKETDDINERPTTFIERSGTSLKAALDVGRKLGSVPENLLPFGTNRVFSGRELSFYAKAAQLKIKSYISLGRDPSAWRDWIYQNGPILTRLNVDSTFMDAKPTTSRLQKYDLASAQGGHAISLVGYTKDGFIVRNSWSTDWGSKGYVLATDAYAIEAFTENYGITV